MSEILLLHQTPILDLKGIRPLQQERLAYLGINTVQDLLLHLPIRYENRTQIIPIANLNLGKLVLIEGTIRYGKINSGRRKSLLVLIADDSGSILLRFFNFNYLHRTALQPGVRLRCYGEVRQGPNSLEIVHPEYQLLDTNQPIKNNTTLTPVYSTTEGLHQLHWRTWIEQALELLTINPQRMPELLPIELPIEISLWPLLPALKLLHNPPADVDTIAINEYRHPAQQRLAFEELLAHQISMRRLRLNNRNAHAPILANNNALGYQFVAQLPFQLTTAQQRVINEIAIDLARSQPMLRLLQGDVGAGKTMVAIMAALQAIESGYQVALMVPTELLAEQHQRCIRDWLAPLGIEVAWLKRQRDRQRRRILENLASNQPLFVVGTHALIQNDVNFASLGLVIIDEQHRFGVHQRLALRAKGIRNGFTPHQLVMTATPIPRSLAITAYADLDISILDEQPAGRGHVITAVVPDSRRDEVIAKVRAACTTGRQAYWICTLIDESDSLQYQAAETTAALLQQVLQGIKVGLVHGRMKPAQREAVMAEFKLGTIGLLVATTVIEVGLDVANASLIIIENPERLGLAQLHQLRGRVGRGSIESHCLLMYHTPLAASAAGRLRIIRSTNDGFAIARQDLELRGPGELLGTRQAGEVQFKIADLIRDQNLLELAQVTADWMLKNWPNETLALEARWQVARKDDVFNVMQ